MSLSKERRAELIEIVKRGVPSFDGEVSPRRINDTLRAGNSYYREQVAVVNSVAETPCCGLMILEGLAPLYHRDTVKQAVARAYFELWLKQPFVHRDDEFEDSDPPDVAAIYATTAVDADRGFSDIENFLMKMGFKPVSRGHNPNSGNDVTVWIYAVAPDKLQALTRPAQEKPRVSSSRKAPSRTGRR